MNAIPVSRRVTQGRAICPPPLAYAAPLLIQAIHPDAEPGGSGLTAERGDFSTAPGLTRELDRSQAQCCTQTYARSSKRYDIILNVPALPQVHPDAELIRLCARHDALELQYRGLFDTISDEAERDVQLSMIDAVQDELLPRILELRATTYPGWMARVRTMCLSDPQVAPDAMATLATSGYSNERQMAALIRDLAAHAGIGA